MCMKMVWANIAFVMCFVATATAQNAFPLGNPTTQYLDNYSYLGKSKNILAAGTPLISDGVGTPPGSFPFIFGASGQQGVLFNNITPLSPISIGSTDTQHKPQAKTWYYAGKWWAALPPSIGGTRLFRLDGTTWTQIMTIHSSGSRTDCWVDGNLVHILMFRGSGANQIATLEYDPILGTYKAWNKRATPTTLSLPSGVEAATLTVDGTGRMWVAADAVNDIFVYWSDAPYTSWSAGINVATGINSDDISVITKLPGRIGVFWSNQNTGLFGFRTHVDGTHPTAWTVDELPASQSAIPGNNKLADDHMNATVASDGTLYVVAKTSYNSKTMPTLILLVRRPNGMWDNLYPVTIGDGTQAIVLLNETLGKLKVVYTSETNGGTILYRESSTSNISFGAAATLMGTAADDVNFATSTHQTYSNQVVVLATKQAPPRQIISVMASDAPLDYTPPEVNNIVRQSPTEQNTTATSLTFAVNFSEPVTGVDINDFMLITTGDAQGTISSVSGSGSSYTVTVNSITGTGSIGIGVLNSGTDITDAAGNALTGGYNSGETYIVSPADIEQPVVNSILRQSPPEQNTTATSVTFAVNFSESVTGVDVSDFLLITGGTAQGTISSVSGSGSTYTVTVSGISGSGSIGIIVKFSETGITDLAGNPLIGGFNGGETYTVSPANTSAPVVSSIVRQSPTEQNTTATSVTFAIQFSQPVNGVDISDFMLTTTGSVTGAISQLLGSCSEYTVTVTNITGFGTLRLDLKPAGTSIVSAVGTPIAGGFNTGEQYVYIPQEVNGPINGGRPIGGPINPDEVELQRKPYVNGISTQAFPNPFAGTTTIAFRVASNQPYSVWLTDSWGRQLRLLSAGRAIADTDYRIKLDGLGLPSGIYLVSIKYGSKTTSLKIVKQ